MFTKLLLLGISFPNNMKTLYYGFTFQQKSSPCCFSPLSILTFTPTNLIQFCEKVMRNVFFVIILSSQNELYSLRRGIQVKSEMQTCITVTLSSPGSSHYLQHHLKFTFPLLSQCNTQLVQTQELKPNLHNIKASIIWEHEYLKCNYILSKIKSNMIIFYFYNIHGNYFCFSHMYKHFLIIYDIFYG